MMTVNYLKAIVACLAITGVVVLSALGRLTGSEASLMIGTVVGYVLGNGVNARNGQDIPGIIRPKPEGRRADDHEDDDGLEAAQAT